MMDLLAIKEIASKLQPELSKMLESIDANSIDLDELDRPILEQKDAKSECEEGETRPLTQEEKEHYKEKLGCSGHLLESATIDEDGKIHLKTINESKEGQIGEDGVEYVLKTIEVNGIEVEGVFPQFESAIDVQLPDELLQATDSEQAKFANQELKEKVQNDPEFAKQFNDEQLEQIENGDTPDGYTWHHNEEPGEMQLISTEDHQNNRHTGGKAIWGGGKENR
ncbi:HNH endonuclease [Vibrio antiquarius]|uniref:HNH endonuclease n=2 Tax=Vibrionaceae TaxID=641 RepID=UPI000681A291|nr:MULTISPECIES: HNH endonuclease [Vibrio]EKO3838861.1 HNH endonuclease [Vibrio harveyi]MBT0112728.1 HNH endonuclease [Vibrio alginolyticus]MBT2967520.1 HNH endonuclease [Vibrio anguillarum]MDE1236047.1 HNH endonuclease [Vibrio aestuarianus]MDE1246925.1 HNH endonuclease [Vibrio aestuarianus]